MIMIGKRRMEDMIMEKYQKPVMDIIEIEKVDVLTASGNGGKSSGQSYDVDEEENWD